MKLPASSLRQQSGKVLFSGHRACKDEQGKGVGAKKDVGVIVSASFNDIAFPSGTVTAVH